MNSILFFVSIIIIEFQIVTIDSDKNRLLVVGTIGQEQPTVDSMLAPKKYATNDSRLMML